MRAGRAPFEMSRLAFVVVAPLTQINNGVFGDLVTAEHIRRTVQDRVNSYEGAKDRWFEKSFLPTLDEIELSIVSWEEALHGLPDIYGEFFRRCQRYNSVGEGRARIRKG